MKLLVASTLWLGLLAGGVYGGEEKKPEGKAEANQQAGPEDSAKPKTLEEKASYTIGNNIAKNLKRQSVEVNFKFLVKGMEDGLSGDRTLLTAQEMQEVMRLFQAALRKKQEKESQVAGEKNKVEGTAFLAENKGKEGVQTTASGLQYKVIKAGEGPKPKATDTVEVHYRGTLIDGTEFDSSYSRGQPATFQANRVIKGWVEALQLMPVGSKWQLFIPSDLAYGTRGAGGDIGPNATLIFEVELLSIK